MNLAPEDLEGDTQATLRTETVSRDEVAAMALEGLGVGKATNHNKAKIQMAMDQSKRTDPCTRAL